MRQRYIRSYRYRFVKPPQAFRNARLDNIAIVPASLLPLTGTIQEMLNNLPKGGVFLWHVTENVKQKRVLERVEEVFRQHGHVVKSMSMEQVL